MARFKHRVLLRVLKETDTEIIGEDSDGRAYVFTKADVPLYVVNKRDNSVAVTYYYKQLRSTTYDHDRNPSPIKRVTRNCLLCHHPFRAPEPYRICYTCKGDPMWKYGGSYSMGRK